MVVDHSPVPLEEQREKTPEHLHFVFNLDEHNRREIVHSLHVTNLVIVASIGFEDIEKLIVASLIVSRKQLCVWKRSVNVLLNQVLLTRIVHVEQLLIQTLIVGILVLVIVTE